MDDVLLERVVAVIARTRGPGVGAIDVDRPFSEQGVDSLEALNLLFAIEEEFEVTLPEGAQRSKTLRDLVAVLRVSLPNDPGIAGTAA